MVVIAVNEKSHQGCLKSNPQDNDSMFVFHKTFSISGLQVCIANHQALLARYDFSSWDMMSRFLSILLEEVKAGSSRHLSVVGW